MMEQKKNIIDHLEIFYHRKWFFIIPLIAGAIIGLALAFKLPEYYSSTTLIVVEEQQVPEEYVTPSDKTPFAQRLNVISQQILSRTKLQQIIREFGLYEHQAPGLLSKALKALKGEPQDAPARDEVIEAMRSDIEFKVIGDAPRQRGGASNTGGNAFTITYSGRDPEVTMQVTNTIASLFIEENLKAREQYAEGTSEFLGNELERAKEELEQQEQKLKGFKELNMGSLPEQLDANLRTLDRLQMELQNVAAGIRTNEDRKVFLEQELKRSPAAALPPVSAELERLRGELALLLSMFKENYPDVVIIKKRIKELESMPAPASSEAGNAGKPVVTGELSAVGSELSNLRQREVQIRKQIADFEKRVESTPSSEQKQADLLRDHKISLDNYQALLGKKLNARLSENLEKRQKGARFKVIDPANIPESPTKPNKPLVAFLGLFGGAVAGAGLVLIFEFINPAFRKPEDFDGVFTQPVLTTIPVIPLHEKANLTLVQGRK
ncbi:MAG: hypothetical protein HY954_12690 [Deltaproteobacteria bacterium]|nr:hypothetical protein [Deltaproteobacteria bacterium]